MAQIGVEGFILTDEQISQWQDKDQDEFDFYVSEGLFDPETKVVYEPPEWMYDGLPNGPFDFNLRPSNDTSGW